MAEVAQTYLQNEGYSRSISHLEHASLILVKLEGKDARCASKLDTIYVQLAELYLMVDKDAEFSSIVELLEGRLEAITESEDRAYEQMNELGVAMRRLGRHDLASTYFKKALLCIKRRYKSSYKTMEYTQEIAANLNSCQ